MEFVWEYRQIVITAESSETECDRKLQLITTDPRRQYLDFSTEICNYVQVDLEETGYFFEVIPRSRISSGTLRIEPPFLLTDAWNEWRELKLSPLNRPENLRSPNMRWFGTPVLTIEPNTKAFSITPVGDTFWEYSHVWDMSQMERATLSFELIPKRLFAPEGLLVTDQMWLFAAADEGSQTGSISIEKDHWIVRGPVDDFTLVFDNVQGQVFAGPQQGVFIGRPEISLDEAGNLIVRSNGDRRIQFLVERRLCGDTRMEIVFTLADSAHVGSWPVVAGPDDDACPICLEEFTRGSMIAETRCKHRFHLGCLRRVAERRCPLCRGSLKEHN